MKTTLIYEEIPLEVKQELKRIYPDLSELDAEIAYNRMYEICEATENPRVIQEIEAALLEYRSPKRVVYDTTTLVMICIGMLIVGISIGASL